MQAWVNLLEELDNLMYCAYETLKETKKNDSGYQLALANLTRLYHSYIIVCYLIERHKVAVPTATNVADMRAIKDILGIPYSPDEYAKTGSER